MSALPAHSTKHLPLLNYTVAGHSFSLAQLDNGVSNGTALWLGGQCLAFYLADIYGKPKKARAETLPRAIELGSGIGFTALALCSLGWDVLATDTSHVISSVLSSNIHNNIHGHPSKISRIQVRELDWTVPPEKWVWHNKLAVASHLPISSENPIQIHDLLTPPYDLIYSADTVYKDSLIEPFLRTLHALSTLSIKDTNTIASHRAPPILLCIERRDPLLVDRLLAEAKEIWHFSVYRIPRKKLANAIRKSGVKWDREEWLSIELWRLKLST